MVVSEEDVARVAVSEEDLAQALHEAGRAAVEAACVVNPVPGQRFKEWGEITEEAREGRRIQARALLAGFMIQRRP